MLHYKRNETGMLTNTLKGKKMEEPSIEIKKRKVVIAMDGSKNAEDAFKWYVDKLHEKGDYAIVVYTPEFKKLTHVSITTADPALMTKLISEEQQQTRLLLGEIHELMNVCDVKGTVKQKIGDPGEQVLQVAEDEGADFIVTGSRGLGTIRRTLLGSVSDYIVHHASVPVFVCKAESTIS